MKSSTVFYWLPRIICILAILFVSMFAADAFAPGLTIWQQVGTFIIHLIPSFVLAVILILAWNRELFGGLLFIIIGLGLSPFIYQLNFDMNHSFWTSLSVVMMINSPFIIVGILFLVSRSLGKKHPEISK